MTTTIQSILQRVTGVAGDPPSDAQARELARELHWRLTRGSRADLLRQDVYCRFLFHLGVSQMEAVDGLFKQFPVAPNRRISHEEFVGAICRHCKKLESRGLCQTGPAGRVVTTRILRAAKSAGQPAPKVQVLRGCERMNKLSNTNAFRMAIVDRASARSMYEVYCEMQGGEGKGGIDMPHFKAYLRRHKPALLHMAQSIFNSMDQERAGCLTFPLLLTLFYPDTPVTDLADICRMAGYKHTTPTPAAGKDMDSLLNEVKTVFQVFAGRGGDQLDEEQMAAALQLAGFSEKQARHMFPLIDKDGSGTITFDEFKEWYVSDTQRRQEQAQSAAAAAAAAKQRRSSVRSAPPGGRVSGAQSARPSQLAHQGRGAPMGAERSGRASRATGSPRDLTAPKPSGGAGGSRSSCT